MLILASRNSYLPVHVVEAILYFTSLCSRDNLTNFYLLYDLVPIQWHLPIGVLYDISYKEEVNWVVNIIEVEPNKIPKGFDPSLINLNSLKEVVMNLVKQLSFVLSSSSKLIMGLNPLKTDQFWNAIVKHNWIDYTKINHEIIPKNIVRIPVKLLVIGSPVVVQAPVEAQENITLSHVISQSVLNVALNSVKIHGIEFDQQLQAQSITKVWRLFKYVDNFLYIVVEKA